MLELLVSALGCELEVVYPKDSSAGKQRPEAVVAKKGTDSTLAALHMIRQRFSDGKKIYVILDNILYHKGDAVTHWAGKNKIELCFTPTYAWWANPIEPHFGGVRHFVLKNCNYPNHRAQSARLRAYLRWRNANKRDPKLLAVQRRERQKIRCEKATKAA